MFAFFRNIRINRYIRAVNVYVDSNYRWWLWGAKPGGYDGDVRFKLPVGSKDGPGSSRTREIKYSGRGGDPIPNHGDGFRFSSVRNLLYGRTNEPSLRKLGEELDSFLNLTFVDMLIRYINEKGWRDSRVYKAAQMDRRLFSKIMSDRNYKPSRDTALALVFALELSLDQANDLLRRAGYTLSHSIKRDVIIEYFLRERIYNLSDINEVLYRLDQKIIGR